MTTYTTAAALLEYVEKHFKELPKDEKIKFDALFCERSTEYWMLYTAGAFDAQELAKPRGRKRLADADRRDKTIRAGKKAGRTGGEIAIILKAAGITGAAGRPYTGARVNSLWDQMQKREPKQLDRKSLVLARESFQKPADFKDLR